MIAEGFAGLRIQREFHGYDQQLNLERFVYYSGEMDLHGDTLYVFSEDMLSRFTPGILTIEPGTALLFHSDGFVPEGKIFEQVSSIMISPMEISQEKLTNLLLAIFEKYQRLDALMRSTIYTKDSMQYLIEIATRLFDNELTLRNSLHQYVAHSYRQLRFMDKGELDGYTSTEIMGHLRADKNYKENVDNTAAWYYRYYDNTLLCFDIYVRGVFVYRLKLIDVNHPFRPYDAGLVVYVADIIKEKYMAMIELEDLGDNEIRDIFIAAIKAAKQGISDAQMAVLKQRLGFEEQDSFWLLCLKSGKNTGDIQAYQYYCMYLNKIFDMAYSFLYEERIYLVIDLSKCRIPKEKLRNYIVEFMRNENFRTGFSMEFSDLFKIAGYFRQAALALELGMKYNPEIWGYFFLDYRRHYLLEKIAGDFSHGKYIMPELCRLSAYDRENNTDYFQTLGVYLKSGCNVTHTAQQLNIHRTTLNYRLQKIHDITKIDIEDRDYLSLLTLFYQIYEINPSYI